MVKINTLELENIKRIRAVRMEPSPSGLTVIGGRNNQGKTSVLDAIAWALGGNKFRPSQAHREGSLVPPHLKIQLSNGLVVERKGKNSDLKITDPAGYRMGNGTAGLPAGRKQCCDSGLLRQQRIQHPADVPADRLHNRRLQGRRSGNPSARKAGSSQGGLEA